MVSKAPRKKVYRTMQGRYVDIEKLRAANESVRAIGNMSVNARGDVLGPGGQVVKPKSEVMQKYYEQPRGMVDDTPRRQRPAPVNRIAPAPKTKIAEVKPAPKPRVTKKATPKKAVEKKGIDAALDGLE